MTISITGLISAKLPPQNRATPIEQTTAAANVKRRLSVSFTTRRKFFIVSCQKREVVASNWSSATARQRMHRRKQVFHCGSGLLAKVRSNCQDQFELPGLPLLPNLINLAQAPPASTLIREERRRLHP